MGLCSCRSPRATGSENRGPALFADGPGPGLPGRLFADGPGPGLPDHDTRAVIVAAWGSQ